MTLKDLSFLELQPSSRPENSVLNRELNGQFVLEAYGLRYFVAFVDEDDSGKKQLYLATELKDYTLEDLLKQGKLTIAEFFRRSQDLKLLSVDVLSKSISIRSIVPEALQNKLLLRLNYKENFLSTEEDERSLEHALSSYTLMK